MSSDYLGKFSSCFRFHGWSLSLSPGLIPDFWVEESMFPKSIHVHLKTIHESLEMSCNVVRSTLLPVTRGRQTAQAPILLSALPGPLRPKISLAQVYQMNDTGCQPPLFSTLFWMVQVPCGAKHSPPARGPFGGPDGQMAR